MKMPDKTDRPYEDRKPLIVLLPLCTEATTPSPTGRQLLLDPGNGGCCVQVMLLQVGKVDILWMSLERALFDRVHRVTDHGSFGLACEDCMF